MKKHTCVFAATLAGFQSSTTRQVWPAIGHLCNLGLALLFVAVLGAATGAAQEARGSITGIITDPHGLVVPGADVTGTNIATGVRTHTVTTAGGNYVLLYLIPGTYSVTVEHTGFDKLLRPNIEVHVGDEVKIDLKLTVGSVKQEVTVEGGTPAIQTANADVGETFDRQEISDLPLPDSNPFTLTQLVTGTVFTGNPKFTRPFDNGDVSAIRVNGAEGGSDFTLNGIPNNGAQKGWSQNVVGFQPPVDAIEDFKMTTGNYTAKSGNTAAGSINVNTKSGTNTYHGTLYEFWRNEALAANDFFGNNTGQKRAVVRYNHFGGTLGGPVNIHGLYHGRDKTFFFVAAEALPDTFPNRGFFTVPTAAERQGDLSGVPIQLYDPYGQIKSTGSGHVQRLTPYPNNQIPASELNTPSALISQAVLQYYPLPNLPGKSDGSNNYISQNPRADSFHSFMVRGDQVIGTSQRLSATYFQNWREEISGDYSGIVNGIRPAGGDLQYVNWGVSLDHTVTLSPTLLLDVRAGWNRFGDLRGPTSAGFDPAKLGFSPAVTSLFLGRHYLPVMSINDFAGFSGSTSDNRRWNGYTVAPTLTKITGDHTLSFGYEGRLYRFNQNALGNGEGQYTFNGDFARQTDQSSNQIGQGLVDFLVGQPTSVSIDRNTSRANQGLYHALFAQDDWKLTSKLTLDIGVRWELEMPTTERFDRNVRGFDLTTPLSIQGAVQAQFNAAYPTGFQPFVLDTKDTFPAALLALPPVTTFQVRGGYTFAGPGDRGFWIPNPRNFEPRVGFAYAPDQHTVIRGGWAIYSVPLDSRGDVAYVNQAGFNVATSPTITNDNGQHFLANFANPFPFGVLNPHGNADGMFTDIGGSVTDRPTHIKIAKTQHWTLQVQRELPGSIVLDAAYVGSHAYDLARNQNSFDTVPAAFLSTSNIRDASQTAINNALTAKVPNPFVNNIPSQYRSAATNFNNSPTITASQLLGMYPQFTSLSTPNYSGTNNYHSAQVRIIRRFKQGYSFSAAYTWSKLLENFAFLNAFDARPDYELSGNDIPQRLAVTFIGQVPFGHGRHWGGSWPGWMDAIFGGWQTQGIYQVQTGEPLGFGNLTYFGPGGCDGTLSTAITSCPVAYPSKLHAHYGASTIGQGLPVFDTSGFYIFDSQVVKNGQFDPNSQRGDKRIQLVSNVRTFPHNFGNLRAQGINNMDLSVMKKIAVRERMTMELRGEFLNAFNHPFFNAPGTDPTKSSFGVVTGQRNLPREVQIGLKVIF